MAQAILQQVTNFRAFPCSVWMFHCLFKRQSTVSVDQMLSNLTLI
uniref:Uncharacterized protein n=1 Tax=Anguilla anguilla TaxID=7936 RepID=A0A0E9VKI9_ANGAN